MTDDELRDQIAEKLGYEVHEELIRGEPVFRLYKDGDRYSSSAWKSPRMCLDHDAPDWVHDIGAAWELVDQAHACGECLSLTYLMTENKVFEWQAFFRLSSVFPSRADTAPRAICEAWLKWKESEK